jgi:hypothetical protein
VVEVAHLESKVRVLASVPQLNTPAALAFTSQDAVLRLDTTNAVVEAVPVIARLVVVAFVAVAFPRMFKLPLIVELAVETKPVRVVRALNVFVFVKVFAKYVFGIVVDASMKWMAEVVDHERPTDAKYADDVVEKKSRVVFHASALVVLKELAR